MLDMAELASSLEPAALPALKSALSDTDAAVRYWAVLGHLMRGTDAVHADQAQLIQALDDSSPDVRIAAAETLGRYGNEIDLSRALAVLQDHADWSKHDVFTAVAALNAIDALGAKAKIHSVGRRPTPSGRCVARRAVLSLCPAIAGRSTFRPITANRFSRSVPVT